MKRLTYLFLVCFGLNFLIPTEIFSQNYTHTHKARERMEMIKKMKLLESLDLNEKEADKFIVKYTSFEKAIAVNAKQTKETVLELKKAINSNAFNDIKTKSEKLTKLKKELASLQTKRLDELHSILSDKNYANFILFEETFFNKLHHAINKERCKRRLRAKKQKKVHK